jgi:hypothetical protein
MNAKLSLQLMFRDPRAQLYQCLNYGDLLRLKVSFAIFYLILESIYLNFNLHLWANVGIEPRDSSLHQALYPRLPRPGFFGL